MEGPLRALCSDTLSEREQLQSNSWFGIMNGLASTAGFALGYITNDIRIIFGVAALIVIITSILTSYLVSEQRHIDKSKQMVTDSSNDDDTELGSTKHTLDKNLQNEIANELSDAQNGKCFEIGRALKEMFYGLTHMPRIVARCWIVQFCTYFSNFACWVYLTDYFGECIMKGDALDTNMDSSAKDIVLRQKYDLGVSYGNLAFMFIAGISAIFSLCSPKLVQWFGLKKLWICCLSIYSMVMIISPFIHHLQSALFLFSFIGFPMGASFTLPWSVVSSYSSKMDPNNAGLWLSSLNVAECVPELVFPTSLCLFICSFGFDNQTIGLLGGLIIDQFGNNVSSVFFIAGIVNLISVFLVLKVDTNMVENDNIDESEYDVVDNLEDIDECNKESTSDDEL